MGKVNANEVQIAYLAGLNGTFEVKKQMIYPIGKKYRP
jgi:hypothetical protein